MNKRKANRKSRKNKNKEVQNNRNDLMNNIYFIFINKILIA